MHGSFPCPVHNYLKVALAIDQLPTVFWSWKDATHGATMERWSILFL